MSDTANKVIRHGWGYWEPHNYPNRFRRPFKVNVPVTDVVIKGGDAFATLASGERVQSNAEAIGEED